MILATNVISFEILLSGAVTTNQLPYTVGYININLNGVQVSDISHGLTNNTTAVTPITAPAPGVTKIITYVSIRNQDTAGVTLTVRLNDNSTLRNILIVTLTVGDVLLYTVDSGWFVINSSGSIKSTASAVNINDLGDVVVSSPSTNQLLLYDGTNWVNGTAATVSIANDAVTYAKIQNVSATDRLLGRSTAGAGDVEEITCTSAGRAILDDADATAQRTTLGLGTLATQSGTFSGTSSGTNTGDQAVPSAASQAEQEAASSTTVYTSPGTQKYHPGNAKVWLLSVISAGVPQVTASYNVTSITDNGVGDATVNFTTAFSSASYSCMGSPEDAGSGPDIGGLVVTSRLAGSVRATRNDGTALADLTAFHVACFGDQ